MNKYATQAMRHWETYLPQRYQRLPDPQQFFTEMGEQISAQVRELSLVLAGQDPPGEGYLDKVGRLNMARFQAEERVMREIALHEPEASEVQTLSTPKP